MKTRKHYMNGEISHKEYYSQFVDGNVINMVVNAIGKDKILKSNDEHFNDIPLQRWDNLAGGFDTQLFKYKLKEAGDFPSLAVVVCILKQAARIFKESELVRGMLSCF